jgi:hypothetical protein
MTQVKIVPNSKTGSVITAYQNNPKFGYVQLEQSAKVFEGNWIRKTKRTTLLRAEMEVLSEFIAEQKSLFLSGKIVVKEYLESEVPQEVVERFLNKSVDYETAIEPYVKRAGQDGVQLTYGGERILRFTSYDASGNDTDSRIAHDNVEAVRESASARSTANANLG